LFVCTKALIIILLFGDHINPLRALSEPLPKIKREKFGTLAKEDKEHAWIDRNMYQVIYDIYGKKHLLLFLTVFFFLS
jgi:hypothetical protein